MTDRRQAPDAEKLSRLLEEIVAEMRDIPEWGKVSDYIPELAEVEVQQFGLAVLTRGGDTIAAGDADEPFSLQSISKVFSLVLALEAFGDDVWKRVGREPSGDPYNSITDLERHQGIPRNPFINPGALVIIDMLLEGCRDKDAGETDFVHRRLAELIGDDFEMDDKVRQSEQSAGYTNRALANLAKSFGNLHSEVDDVMRVYVRQCAIALSCRQLAKAGRCLMSESRDSSSPADDEQVLRARRIASLMLTCGQYDGSGDFAFRVGLPAKSGIGGGILAIVPDVASIAVWSPGLDKNGNSLLGTLALERLSKAMNWSVFGGRGR
jgi:glutaminase